MELWCDWVVMQLCVVKDATGCVGIGLIDRQLPWVEDVEIEFIQVGAGGIRNIWTLDCDRWEQITRTVFKKMLSVRKLRLFSSRLVLLGNTEAAIFLQVKSM